MILVEVHGLEVPGHHGVEPEERARLQPFLYDLRLEVSDAALSDRIEDAVDYREVAAAVREIAGRPRNLLEVLATEIADTLRERFPAERARVRVRKPEVRPAGIELEFAAVTAERP